MHILLVNNKIDGNKYCAAAYIASDDTFDGAGLHLSIAIESFLSIDISEMSVGHYASHETQAKIRYSSDFWSFQ